MSSVAVARLISGRPCSRVRTRPAATIGSCRQASFIGPAIQRGSFVVHARQCRTCPEARRRGLAHLACCAAVFVASAIQHSTSMPDRPCFTWTRLRSMDRPSAVACTPTLQRMLYRSDSRTPNPLFRVSPMHVNKKQPFRRGFDEKFVHYQMRCIDVTESRRDIAAGAVCQSRDECSATLIDRYKRRVSRDRCSSRSGG